MAPKMFLIFAVVLGVLATVLAFGFIQNSAGADRGPKITITIAKRDLQVNSTIDPARDLDVLDIPGTFRTLQGKTLDPTGRNNYKGEVVNRNIPAGQPVFLADIANYGVFEINDPFVAMPKQAEPGIAIPGDYVKIMVARPDVSGAATAGTDP